MKDQQAAATGDIPEPPARQRRQPSLEQMSAKIRAAAADIARTEDQVAATFERIAQQKPGAADRLKFKAAQARQFAAQLRRQISSAG